MRRNHLYYNDRISNEEYNPQREVEQLKRECNELSQQKWKLQDAIEVACHTVLEAGIIQEMMDEVKML